jgi:sporulation protein YqfC
MNLFNKLDRYLTDTDYKIIIKENYLNIINYKEIKDFSNKKIVISATNTITTITGENLVVSKMQDNEILISGKIKTIEL